MLVLQLSDNLCYEQGLSVVEVPSKKGVSYDVWQDKQRGIDWKQLLKKDLDSALADSKTLTDFKKVLKVKVMCYVERKRANYLELVQKPFAIVV